MFSKYCNDTLQGTGTARSDRLLEDICRIIPDGANWTHEIMRMNILLEDVPFPVNFSCLTEQSCTRNDLHSLLEEVPLGAKV